MSTKGSISTAKSFCEACTFANMKPHYSQNVMPCATKPLQRAAYIDIACGGKTLGGKDTDDVSEDYLSRQNARFFLLLTNDATRCRWVHFLEKKLDAAPCLKHWTLLLRHLAYTPATSVMSDIDIVFRIKTMADWFFHSGMVWQSTTRDSTWQTWFLNGASESLSRPRSSLLSSGLRQRSWLDIVQH